MTVAETGRPPADIRGWIRSVRGLTMAAASASIIGTAIVAGALALAHSLVVRENINSTVSLGPITVDLPDSTATVLIVAAIALTLASVVQSVLRRIDATIVRRRLGQVTGLAASRATPLSTRLLMAERHLLESWARMVSAVVQAAGYSVALAWVGGAPELLGMVAACVLTAAVSASYFRRATVASNAFVTAQRNANRLQRSVRRGEGNPTEAELSNAMVAVADAVYRRDNETFRISAGQLTLLSIGVIAAAVIPALLTMTEAALPLFLLVLFIWRSRMIDAVHAFGPLAWSVATWRNAAQVDPTVDEADLNAEEEV